MARVIKPLSITEINNAKIKDRDYKLYDGKGLFLKVCKSGSKLWYFRYKRIIDNKETTIGLGAFPALSLNNARKKREEFLSHLALGEDPLEKRKETIDRLRFEKSNTLNSLVEKWIPVKKSEVMEKTFICEFSRFRLHILPKLGNTPIKDITIPLVIETMQYLGAEGKTGTRRKLAILFREIMTFATITGMLSYNPLSDLLKALPRHTVSHQPTIPPSQLPILMRDINSRIMMPTTKLLILWQLLTMVRPSEAVSAEWTEIDWEKEEWVIPKEKMKGRERMKRSHIVPLSSQALYILRQMKMFTGSEKYIFASRTKPDAHINRGTVNRELLEMGYKNRLTAHGMRSIANTYLNDSGVEGDVVEACLSHKVGGTVRNSYNRSTYFELRRPVMQLWGNFVEKCAQNQFNI